MNHYCIVLKYHADGTPIHVLSIKADNKISALKEVDDNWSELRYWQEVTITEIMGRKE
jgi:hypothetical protein